MLLCAAGVAADAPRFTGRLAVELIDAIDFNHRFRLLEDFGFIDARGKSWIAPRGGIVDDEAVPREFQALMGLPYFAEYRKAAMVHAYFRQQRTQPWQPVHRMLYEAAVAEGVTEWQARVLYAAVYAAGWRWEPPGSSCYRSCHASATSLGWRPDVTAAEIDPVLQWITQSNPALDEIDARLDATIAKPGPHLFAQHK